MGRCGLEKSALPVRSANARSATLLFFFFFSIFPTTFPSFNISPFPSFAHFFFPFLSPPRPPPPPTPLAIEATSRGAPRQQRGPPESERRRDLFLAYRRGRATMLHGERLRDLTARDVKETSSRTAERRSVHAYSIDAILGLGKVENVRKRCAPGPADAGNGRCTPHSGTDSGSETASNGMSANKTPSSGSFQI